MPTPAPGGNTLSGDEIKRRVQIRQQAFGNAVRVRRKRLDISQEKLAERAGCDRQSINRIENAAYSPSLNRVFLLAEALGCPLAELLADVDEAYTAQLAAEQAAAERAQAQKGTP